MVAAAEDSGETVVIGVAGEAPKRPPPPVPSPQHRLRTLRPGVGPSIQTFPLATAPDTAIYITGGVEELIFVRSQLPVRGRIFSHPSLQETIEKLTSSADLTVTSSEIY